MTACPVKKKVSSIFSCNTCSTQLVVVTYSSQLTYAVFVFLHVNKKKTFNKNYTNNMDMLSSVFPSERNMPDFEIARPHL